MGGTNDEIAVWDISDLLASMHVLSGNRGNEIHWDLGTLQFSPTVNGPWIDLPAASPMPLSPIADKGFFRVKVPTSAQATAGRDD